VAPFIDREGDPENIDRWRNISAKCTRNSSKLFSGPSRSQAENMFFDGLESNFYRQIIIEMLAVYVLYLEHARLPSWSTLGQRCDFHLLSIDLDK
jgi:hypothetical protein